MARKRHQRSFLRIVMVLTLLALVGAGVARMLGAYPQHLPWAPLQLDQPVGLATAWKLARLGNDFPACRALMADAGAPHQLMTPRGEGACRRDDNFFLRPSDVRWKPATIAPSCPVVAALEIWRQQAVQPLAQEIFGQPVAVIRHLGAFNCREIAGGGQWSEHATANAIDIAAFVLADGTVISVLDDWNGSAAKARFLRALRDDACRVFATVLSPDYNRAHADHFHFDQAARGQSGYRICR